MDGFYDRRSCQGAAGNPSSWAGYTGQDFLPQHAVPAIDFAAIHLWPDNWKRTDQDFGPIWLNTHSKNGRQLGKPVVLEEFGKVRLPEGMCPSAAGHLGVASGRAVSSPADVHCGDSSAAESCSAERHFIRSWPHHLRTICMPWSDRLQCPQA